MLLAPDARVATRGVVKILAFSFVAATMLFAWLAMRWFESPPADVDMENVPAVELTR